MPRRAKKSSSRKADRVKAATVVVEPFDPRQVKHALACARVGARRAKKSKIVVGPGGYPAIKFRANEAGYYRVFDAMESCLYRKRPRTRNPCAKGTKKQRAMCNKKMDVARAAELAKIKKALARRR